MNSLNSLKYLEKNQREVIYIFAVTALFYLFFFFTQDRILGNVGWDGEMYFNMVDKNFNASLPFALRIALPRFIDYFPVFSDNLNNFLLYQSLIGFLFSYFSWKLLRTIFRQASFNAIFIGWIFLNLSELSIFKNILWIPPGTDALNNLLFICLLLVIFLENMSLKKNLLLMFIIFFIGTLNRENFLTNYILVLLFYLVKFKVGHFYFSPIKFYFIKLLSPIFGIICSGILIYNYTGHFIVGNKIEVLKFFYQDLRFFVVLLAILMTYGQFFIIIFSSMNKKVNIEKKYFFHLFAFLIFSITISFLGGQNFERYLWWYSSILVIFSIPKLDYLIKNKKYLTIFNSILFFLIVHRVFVPIDTLTNPDTITKGCSFVSYIKGYSPNLMHFGTFCANTATLLQFYILIIIFFSLVMLEYIKIKKI